MKILNKEWKLKGDKKSFKIKENSITVKFDIIARMQNGMLFCINIQRDRDISVIIYNLNRDKVHRILGYSNEDATIVTVSISD